jgi:DNA-binding response OmpR family regulator
MDPKLISVLHVEDEPIDRHIVAYHLAAVPEYHFEVTCVDGEDEAVELLSRGGIGLVVLDYGLSQGNGLSCLRRMRDMDFNQPILAVSGGARPEIAAELIAAGADDYISKHDLTSAAFAQSVRAALTRAAACRVRAAAGNVTALAAERLRQLERLLDQGAGHSLLKELAELEASARQQHWTARQVHSLFESVSGELHASNPSSVPDPRLLLRPIMLDLLWRLFGSC